MKTRSILAAFALSGFALAAACSGKPQAEPPRTPVAADVTGRGRRIYVGRVFPLAGRATEPTYVYERRVAPAERGLRSTHVTRDRAGEVVLADSAVHGADYTLHRYTLHRNQLGQTGTIRVQGDAVSFRRVDADGEVDTAVEHVEAPVAVGPTLVGVIHERLEALRAGRVIPVRLAVLDRLETIGFELESVPAPAGQTRIRMTPSSFLIGLVVDPVHFTFESSTGRLVRLEGRVPTKVRDGDEWADFDARVEYRFDVEAYL